MTEILFETADLKVRCSTAERHVGRWVITFDSLQDVVGLDHAGFAEGILAREGLPAIHILASRPHWFQLPEMDEALRVIRDRCDGAQHILVTGSSMGGYAALRFADRLNATACVAFSPQYSVDPDKVPFETRWHEHRLRIDFQQSLRTALTGVSRTILCFDPHHKMDRKHADLVLSEVEAETLPTAYVGHVVTGHLNDIGLLAPLLRDTLDGTLDLAAVRHESILRRKTSAVWISNLASIQPPHRPECALALARLSIEKSPDNPVPLDALAIALRNVGRTEEAIAAHRAALLLDDASLYHVSLSHTLEAAGDLAGALEVMAHVQERDPHIALHAKRASDLRKRIGDFSGARRDAARALELSPQNRAYQIHWLTLSGHACIERIRRWLTRS